MNRAWHEAHPMPPKATLQQRVEWHIAHQAACGCRDLPEDVKEAIAGEAELSPRRRLD
jgi:hypothetical protein